MYKIIDGLPSVLVHDDVLIFGKTKAEHTEHVRQFLRILKAEKPYAKRSKCAFFQQSVKFLAM